MLTRWIQTWHRLGADPPSTCFEQLSSAYSEPHRHYHTLEHLRACFELYDAIPLLPGKTAFVELALWFHDAVYDTRSADNEARSAAWAKRALSAAGVDPPICERVAELILLTQHSGPLATTEEGRLLVDVDLAILGASPSRFAEYELQIRREYAWVPDDLFRQGRSNLLAELVARQPLYAVATIRDILEQQARTNLTRSLAALRLADA